MRTGLQGLGQRRCSPDWGEGSVLGGYIFEAGSLPKLLPGGGPDGPLVAASFEKERAIFSSGGGRSGGFRCDVS